MTGTPVNESAPLDRYGPVLAAYLDAPGERALYEASLLSQAFVRHGVGPEEIVALHVEALELALAGRSALQQTRCVSHAHQFLLEVMIAYGLTYREYLELKVRQRVQWAEQLERERTELLATVAHELRTPLTAAIGSIDLANRHLAHGRFDPVPPLLGTAKGALTRLSRLTANIARASAGDPTPLTLAPHDLRALLADVCVWVEPAAAESGRTLVWADSPPTVPVVADADAILSVLGNLLSNAVRYTPSGGRITVQCGHNADEGWVTIADTGIGMTPEVQARIFEKFYRAREARDVEAQGLGLGLALARDLVWAHGGRIEVQSAPGVGSTFRVVLPQRRAGDTEEQAG